MTVEQAILSPLLHADAGHLLGNMVMLAVVGPRVCRVLGFWWCALLFLAAGVLANASAAALLDRPVVGASSAVAGVMTAHLVLFPCSRLALLIVLWIALQAVFAGVALDLGGIAWPAHLVGAAIGAAVAQVFRLARRRVPLA